MSPARILIPLLLIAGPLNAEEKSPAQRLVEVVDFNGSSMNTAKAAFKPMLDRFKAQGLPEAAITEISEAADQFFTKTFSDPELKKAIVKLYEKKFTTDEIEEMLHFYETPVGRKALQTMPELMSEGAKIGQDMAAKNTQEFQKQVQDIMAKYKDQKPAEGAEPKAEKN